MADHLQMPSLTQVIKIEVEDGGLRCERQAEYGYDTVQIELPAVISVGDAINEPRYPSLKAIMGAKKKPLETKSAGDAGIEADRVGYDNARAHCADFKAPPPKAAGGVFEDEDTNETVEKIVALARREEAAGMSGILVYALHYEGAFNKNSLGAVSEGAKLAQSSAASATRSSSARASATTWRPSSATTARPRCTASKAPRASPSRWSTRWPRRSRPSGHEYALFGGGLLGFEIGAGLAARLDAGVCMEVTAVRAEDGKLVAERPILQDSQISSVHYRCQVGVIIGRLNAFEVKESGGTATVEDLNVEFKPHS